MQRALDAALSLHQIPIELCHTMRSPATDMHVVDLRIGAHKLTAVIQPLGRADPAREIAVWRELLDAADTCTQPGEQLRRMDPTLLAVQVSAATLVINTEHSRTAVRAAMRMLRSGAVLPLPLGLLWQRTRRGPAQVAAAVVVIGAIAATAMTLTSAAEPHRPPQADNPSAAALPTGGDASLTAWTPNPTPSISERRSSAPPHTPQDLKTSPLATQGAKPADDDTRPTRPPRRSPPPSSSPDKPTASPSKDREESRPTRSARPSEPNWSQSPSRASPPDSTPSRTDRPPASQESPTPQSTRPPAPQPTPSNSPASRDCDLVDVGVDLPILDVDICL
ncbi:hypothetical protein GCM10010412_028510 [Nonomuraea recticatena]|uniref:Uncharacterized protein n=1 Tax=Nonomuraea recticatena TaxID=46178 RepID=A0ABN3RPI1_9ACTN